VAVGQVFRNNAIRISESNLRFREGKRRAWLDSQDPSPDPIQSFPCSCGTLADAGRNVHIILWLHVWVIRDEDRRL